MGSAELLGAAVGAKVGRFVGAVGTAGLRLPYTSQSFVDDAPKLHTPFPPEEQRTIWLVFEQAGP